jgi:hypothetical protein
MFSDVDKVLVLIAFIPALGSFLEFHFFHERPMGAWLYSPELSSDAHICRLCQMGSCFYYTAGISLFLSAIVYLCYFGNPAYSVAV